MSGDGSQHIAENGRPYRVTRDGAILDRQTDDEVGQVHRNDYGWSAVLVSGARSTMHPTRRDACEAAWSMRPSTPPASTPEEGN